jgi:outer membrane protein assembly factor BamD (BamD/ComL family)
MRSRIYKSLIYLVVTRNYGNAEAANKKEKTGSLNSWNFYWLKRKGFFINLKPKIRFMETKIILLALCSFLLSCGGGGNDQAELAAKIEELTGKVYNDTTRKIDGEMAKQYIAACEEYAGKFPADTLSPVLLLKAAETSRNIRDYETTLRLYDNIITNYPDHEKAPQALFLKAFTIDDNLGHKEQAKPIYETFLEKYPNDAFAESARFMLENLYKSDSEIIKGFEEKKQEELE